MNHKMYMKEQSFSTGTWGGSVLSGFTVRCGKCKSAFVVMREVATGYRQITEVRQLTCPYCDTKSSVDLDNEGRVLEDTSYHGDD